jgi:hypothetical protein
MQIDIDTLTEPELIDLNHRVVGRLQFLGTIRAHAAMLDFSIGDRVCFRPAGQAPIGGMLTRHNKKAVTVITDTSCRITSRLTQVKASSQSEGDFYSLTRR